MTPTRYRVLGMMSGTSLDGLDICAVDFTFLHKKWQFSIIKSTTIAYLADWKNKLQNAHLLSAQELQRLSKEYSNFLGDAASNFIVENQLKVDVIASHGHTVYHQPKEKITLQIGNDEALFTATQITTVCDFRTQDVLLGGQGAPLVPIGDDLLFADYAACLNLGGFANTSLKKDGKRIAFDICPVNIVLNYLSEKLGAAYDKDGAFAQSGKKIEALFNALNKLDYYAQPLPKSLGREWVEQEILPKLAAYENIKDVIHTFAEHAAWQIAQALKNIEGEILITGGGAFNSYFINRLKFYGLTNICLPKDETIDQKEALVFAFLGVLRLQNKVNCLQSVTGAVRNHSSGRIYRL